jgi:hypothetical protein
MAIMRFLNIDNPFAPKLIILQSLMIVRLSTLYLFTYRFSYFHLLRRAIH